jgi:hypothetical protein
MRMNHFACTGLVLCFLLLQVCNGEQAMPKESNTNWLDSAEVLTVAFHPRRESRTAAAGCPKSSPRVARRRFSRTGSPSSPTARAPAGHYGALVLRVGICRRKRRRRGGYPRPDRLCRRHPRSRRRAAGGGTEKRQPPLPRIPVPPRRGPARARARAAREGSHSARSRMRRTASRGRHPSMPGPVRPRAGLRDVAAPTRPSSAR